MFVDLLLFCFLYLFFCITISYITLSLIAIDIGITFKLILVRDSVIELDDVAIKTNVSNEFINVHNSLCFLYFFVHSQFLSLK